MITVRFDAPSDLLDAYFDHGRLGGLFVPVAPDAAEMGDEVRVELAFPDGKAFRTRCRVVWRRVVPSPGLPAGLGLEFLATEKHTRDLLLDLAHGRRIPFRPRSAIRLPLALRVKFRTPAGVVDTVTEDVSEMGCLVRTVLEVGAGTEVAVSLRAPGRLLGLGLKATVVRVIPGRTGGLGLRFEFRSDRERRRLRGLLEQATGRPLPEPLSAEPVAGE